MTLEADSRRRLARLADLTDMARVEVVRQALRAFEEQLAQGATDDLDVEHQRLYRLIGRALGYQHFHGKRMFSARTGDGDPVLEVDGVRFGEREDGELFAARYLDDGVQVFAIKDRALVPTVTLPSSA